MRDQPFGLSMHAPAQFSTLRVLAMTIPLLTVAALVVQYVEVFKAVPSGELTALGAMHRKQAPSTPMVPSAYVYGLFVPLLCLCVAIPPLRRRWSVTRGELVVVFCTLFLGVPLLGTALWHQLPVAQLEFARVLLVEKAMAMPQGLWPNEGNLLSGASVEDQAELPDLEWTVLTDSPWSIRTSPDDMSEAGPCLHVEHPDAESTTRIRLHLERSSRGDPVRPAARHAVSAQVRLDNPGQRSQVTLMAGERGDPLREVAYVGGATEPSLLALDRFQTIGRTDFPMPRDLGEGLLLELRLVGEGDFYFRDVRLIETEAVYRYFEGSARATPDLWDSLSPPDRVGVVQVSDEPGQAWWDSVFGPVPWRSWSRPLVAWGLLVVGTFIGIYALVGLFYRQWSDYDRFTFPLQTFLLDLTRGDQRGHLVILRSPPFWIGAGLSLVYLSLAQLKVYVPDVPSMALQLSLPDLVPEGPLREVATSLSAFLQVNVRPAFVAVAFLMSLEMSLSMLVFYALATLYRLVVFFAPLPTISLQAYGGAGFTFDVLWMTGGLLFLACFTVVSARKYLRQTLRQVVGGSKIDGGGALGARTAILGLVVATGMFAGFSRMGDLHMGFVLAYLGAILLLALLSARIRGETGLPHPMILAAFPSQVLVALGGSLELGYRQITFVCQSAFLHMGSFLMLAPILAESMAAAERTGVPLRKLTRCLVFAFLLAVVLGGLVHLPWAYGVGAAKMHLTTSYGQQQYDGTVYVQERMDEEITAYFRDHPEEAKVLTEERRERIALSSIGPWVVAGVSFLMTAGLTALRVIWLGFPLHPLGFVLAFTPAMSALWSSLAVGHVVKRLGLHFGGVQLSRSVLRPFFVGLFVADLLTMVLWRGLEATVLASFVTG